MAKPEQTPRYRVLERSYIDEKLLDPERMGYEDADSPDAEPVRKPLYVDFTGIPGPHLAPVNDAARAMCEQYAERMKAFDVLGSLPVVNIGTEQTMVRA